MKQNLLKTIKKYILGLAMVPMITGCAEEIPVVNGIIVAKKEKDYARYYIYVDLDGDGMVDQKLHIARTKLEWYEYAEVGDTIVYGPPAKDLTVKIGPDHGVIKTINSRDRNQVLHEVELRKMREEIGQKQKTR